MKKIVKATLLAAALTALLCVCAMAETVTGSGFYGIGSASGVTITPQDASGAKVSAQSANVDGVAGYENFYPGSVKLEVTLAGEFAAGENYAVFLMEGSDTVPTISKAIYYINQTTVTSETSITFDVFPMDIGGKKDLTLYITSDKIGFETVVVHLGYVPNGTYELAPYVLGDVNADGKITPDDALLTLQFNAELITLTSTQQSAANVTAVLNGDTKIDPIDALRILQYDAELIHSWTDVIS